MGFSSEERGARRRSAPAVRPSGDTVVWRRLGGRGSGRQHRQVPFSCWCVQLASWKPAVRTGPKPAPGGISGSPGRIGELPGPPRTLTGPTHLWYPCTPDVGTHHQISSADGPPLLPLRGDAQPGPQRKPHLVHRRCRNKNPTGGVSPQNRPEKILPNQPIHPLSPVVQSRETAGMETAAARPDATDAPSQFCGSPPLRAPDRNQRQAQ